MPFGEAQPECKKCNSISSSIWRKDSNNELICHSCFVEQELLKKEKKDQVQMDMLNGKAKNGIKCSKNSLVRLKLTRSKLVPKGKSRRSIFKTKFSKSGSSKVANTVTSSIFYNGQYFQRGDIVAVVDSDDHQTYFAQCSGFMTNPYCKKCVAFNWLLPTSNYSRNEPFDPSCFYLGPEDDTLHDLACVEFVCHAPDDYYKPANRSYTTFSTKKEKSYVSVTL